MRTLAAALLAGLALGGTARAEDILNAESFQDMSEGLTLRFSQGGAVYGAEQYLEDRRVIWQYSDGSCVEGYWYPQDDTLCFVYEDAPAPQCWLFSHRGGDFFARVAGVAAGDPSELRLANKTPAPLACDGPDIGV